jgi:hypothetical protein
MIMSARRVVFVTILLSEVILIKIISLNEYMKKSELICESSHDVKVCSSDIDTWLLQSIGPIFDATMAYPSRGVSADSVRERLIKEHEMVMQNQQST